MSFSCCIIVHFHPIACTKQEAVREIVALKDASAGADVSCQEYSIFTTVGKPSVYLG